MIGLLLSDDLIFTSRVTATARDLGFSFRFAKNSQSLLALALAGTPACVIIDLANLGLKIEELVATLKQTTPSLTIVAYGSHIDTATLKAARAAGCDYVMPRSQFVEALPRDLAKWMKPATG